ncbi:hypothetical protein RRF57_006876 [Xylaria bambusicola]|uniref:Uncharacterized protein n=1 Tax=Xylaria bambusicola TaxID=326684 RepID=A0AAN7ZA28_9PEZI
MPVLDALWQRQAAAILKHTTARAPRPSVQRFKNQARIRSHIRFQSTNSKPSSSSTAPNPAQPTAQTNRISQILTRASRFLPKRLQTSLHNLRSAPLSHIGAFLVLHEITAILPIFGLTYAFYALDWVPTSWVLGPFAAWAEDGLKKYVPYFRRKNWFGLGGEDKHGRADGEEALESELREEVEREKGRESREGKGSWFGRFSRREDGNTPVGTSTPSASNEEVTGGGGSKTVAVWRKVKHAATVDNTEKGYKIGIQIAAAYTITKILLVPRIALSLWLTPWLARSFVGLRQAIQRKRS